MPTFQALWKILTKPLFVTKNSGETVSDPVWEGITARHRQLDSQTRVSSTVAGPWNNFGSSGNMWTPGHWRKPGRG